MRKYFVIISFLILFSAALSAKNPAEKIPLAADVSLNGVFIAEPETSKKIFGDKIRLVEDEDGAVFKVLNKEKTETAGFYAYEGDLKNSFSMFKVEYKPAGAKAGQAYLSGVDHFLSGKGISLGMTQKELLAILGTKYETKKDGNILTIKYRIGESDKSGFLNRYNMPGYFGEYKFKADKLVEFSFGLEYP